MGYFPNGTAGADYEARWCERCLHREDCAVWTAHLLNNYDECDKPDSLLHYLIPISADQLGNEQCRMFIDEAWLSPLSREKFFGGPSTAELAKPKGDG